MKASKNTTFFSNIYQGKRVLVTGHTGFKGSWLSFWLTKLGAQVFGYSNEIPSEPNHYEALSLGIKQVKADICDRQSFHSALIEFNPEIVFHLAAQAIVRTSYDTPYETFMTNVSGTAAILDAIRSCNFVKACVIVTSDKCYENQEWIWGYRESDRLGGKDPYSSSKACAELVVAAYRDSFFPLQQFGDAHNTLLATARAGNVIGGGDWAKDRLIPDLIRAYRDHTSVRIRNPKAVRPWQHVLDPLSGYLLLGAKLLEGKREFSQAWNFGPSHSTSVQVKDVVEACQRKLPGLNVKYEHLSDDPHESNLLKLDCSKAEHSLKWKASWDSATAIENTVRWYQGFLAGKLLTEDDLNNYLQSAINNNASWIG